MRKIIGLLILLAVFTTSCDTSNEGGKASAQSVSAKESDKEDKSFIKDLTYNGFIKEVWDFEKHPDTVYYKGDLPCVIDFYASWCGPCKKVAPIMEKLAEEYNGKIKVYKVNTDEQQKLSAILKVKNIPTVFFFSNNGRQPYKSVGAKDEQYFRSMINKIVDE
ncbi:MAG: thioredoxin [Candidatus Limimorpha sp.]